MKNPFVFVAQCALTCLAIIALYFIFAWAAEALAGTEDYVHRECLKGGERVSVSIGLGFTPSKISGIPGEGDGYYDLPSRSYVISYPNRDNPIRVVTIADNGKGSDRLLNNAPVALRCMRSN